MTKEIILMSISYIVPLILGAVFGVVSKKLGGNKRQDNMLLALGRYTLIDECETILDQGFITPRQYEMLQELYKAYAALNGNGLGQSMYERAIKQKIIEVGTND